MKQNNKPLNTERIAFDYQIETNRRKEKANPSKELPIVVEQNRMKLNECTEERYRHPSIFQTKRIKLQ